MKLSEAVELLRRGGVENPLYDARAIFSLVGKIPMSELVLGGEVADDSAAALAVMRRAEREPLEYVVGRVDFYRESYKIREGVLIPRDDTETLVDFAVGEIPRGELFLDLCTGSGCIALSVLNNTEDTRAIAVDISDSAVALARENAEALGLCPRIEIIRENALGSALTERCFAVLSNPPYVTEAEYEELSEEIRHEPKEAFVGGADGLDFYRAITENYKSVIDSRGFIAFEIGYAQAADIIKIADQNGMSAEIKKDLSGNDRVAVLRKREAL